MREVTWPAVHGWLHEAENPRAVFVLAHGAGSNAQSPLLIGLGTALSQSGYSLLRIDLAYRQLRPSGPPRPGDAAKDRETIVQAATRMRNEICDRVILGGHSYGGRQASMVAAEHPEALNGLLLTSYPLHPPGKPSQLRTTHFPKIEVPCIFVQGDNDPFGSVEEVRSATRAIPGGVCITVVEGAGHDLKRGRKAGFDHVSAAILERLGHLGL
jgi:predicted alpha/beta-hydrolase family hydrolase